MKVTLKDLPLHSVGNEEVLESVCDSCTVTSMVNYSNLWFEGKMTNIRNSDRFFYADVKDVSKLPTTIQVGAHLARVFKPVSMSTCKQCSNEGHRPSDPACPARSTEDIQ